MKEAEWSVELDTMLLERLIEHRPAGPNAHFHLACILQELTDPTVASSALPPAFRQAAAPALASLNADAVWRRLYELFELEDLDAEPPFPTHQDEFFLPGHLESRARPSPDTADRTPEPTTPAPQ